MENSESAEKPENTGIGPASACRGERAAEKEGYCAGRSDVGRSPQLVMRGLDPRIHLLRKKSLRRRMDCRVKPGNDRVGGHAHRFICSTCSQRNPRLYEMTAWASSLFWDCYLQ
jgi:hypothetical protein